MKEVGENKEEINIDSCLERIDLEQFLVEKKNIYYQVTEQLKSQLFRLKKILMLILSMVLNGIKFKRFKKNKTKLILNKRLSILGTTHNGCKTRKMLLMKK